jgi:hypothetical protein
MRSELKHESAPCLAFGFLCENVCQQSARINQVMTVEYPGGPSFGGSKIGDSEK